MYKSLLLLEILLSLKKDANLHPPLFMATLFIAKVRIIHFDRKLTWSYMIDQLAIRSCQQLGAVYCVRVRVVSPIAYKSFVRPIYGTAQLQLHSRVSVHAWCHADIRV